MNSGIILKTSTHVYVQKSHEGAHIFPHLSTKLELTCCSTNMAISINISWSSCILFSNFIISACRASISARVCLACCVSIIIWKKSTQVDTG